jgi:acetoin utilization protein AcuB
MASQCPSCGASLPQNAPSAIPSLTVGAAMTRAPVTLGPEDTLSRAQEVMRRHGIRRVPVLLGERLVGVLAEGDLKRAQPSILDSTPEEFARVMDETPVSRIMITSPVTTTEDTPLVDAVGTLLSTKFGALPVLREGRVVGILTDTDLIRTLADLLAPPRS